MSRNILISALAFCLSLTLNGCGFLLAPVAGTAATAATSARRGPRSVPGSVSDPKILRGSPNRSSMSNAQSPRRGS